MGSIGYNMFLKKYNLAGAGFLKLGFTFSFPVIQTGIAGGKLAGSVEPGAARSVEMRPVAKNQRRRVQADAAALGHDRIEAAVQDRGPGGVAGRDDVV